MTVKESVISMISAILCYAQNHCNALFCIHRMTLNKLCTSCPESDVVGSSKIRIFGSVASARAIISICCWPIDKRRTFHRRIEIDPCFFKELLPCGVEAACD